MQDTHPVTDNTDDLIPVDEPASEAGFVMPVSLTAAAWADCVAWSVDDSRRQLIQSERTRLGHLLDMAAGAFSFKPVHASNILFPVFRVPRDGYSQEPSEVVLRSILVADNDRLSVVIMVMDEVIDS